MTRRRKILIVSPDRLGVRMAGPAIRAVNMALVLSAEHDVRIATWHKSDYSNVAFGVVHTPTTASSPCSSRSAGRTC